MPAPFPIASFRDFYCFEQHVKTCRTHRGLGMVPQWYEVPVFYFSNPAAILGPGEPVWAPEGCHELDYELELAAIIGGGAIPRTEVTKKIWEYIKANNLQDSVNKRNINADAKLKLIFEKDQVTMFEMTRLLSTHLR